MDLQTDEAFLEALLSFFTSIPTADVHQDRPWRQQQRRLLAAQFGPREVESLAVNAIVPTPGEEEEGEGEPRLGRRSDQQGREWWDQLAPGAQGFAHSGQAVGCRSRESYSKLALPPSLSVAGPLDWVVEKEFRNLEVLHGQSDLSSWCAALPRACMQRAPGLGQLQPAPTVLLPVSAERSPHSFSLPP